MQELILKALEKENIILNSKKIEQLTEFANKLEWWNKTHNITGAKSKESIVANIIDALIPTTFVDKPNSLLDVGTGAGFPGLILAIVWSNTKVTLAEPLNKRASFLRFIASSLNLNNVQVFKNRVENLLSEPFELISSRAVTDTKLLLELTKNVSNSDTKYLFYKGSRVFDEIESIHKQYKAQITKRGLRNYLHLTS